MNRELFKVKTMIVLALLLHLVPIIPVKVSDFDVLSFECRDHFDSTECFAMIQDNGVGGYYTLYVYSDGVEEMVTKYIAANDIDIISVSLHWGGHDAFHMVDGPGVTQWKSYFQILLRL